VAANLGLEMETSRRGGQDFPNLGVSPALLKKTGTRKLRRSRRFAMQLRGSAFFEDGAVRHPTTRNRASIECSDLGECRAAKRDLIPQAAIRLRDPKQKSFSTFPWAT
jgi:hypothetical protein